MHNLNRIHFPGEKWKQRRRMLTPSFHFKILEDNLGCMNRNWRKVVQKFVDAKGAPVEPLPIMGRGALDIICGEFITEITETSKLSESFVFRFSITHRTR